MRLLASSSQLSCCAFQLPATMLAALRKLLGLLYAPCPQVPSCSRAKMGLACAPPCSQAPSSSSCSHARMGLEDSLALPSNPLLLLLLRENGVGQYFAPALDGWMQGATTYGALKPPPPPPRAQRWA